MAIAGLDSEVETPRSCVSVLYFILRVCVSRCGPVLGPLLGSVRRYRLSGRRQLLPCTTGSQTACVKSVCMAAAVFVEMELLHKPVLVHLTRNQQMSS